MFCYNRNMLENPYPHTKIIPPAGRSDAMISHARVTGERSRRLARRSRVLTAATAAGVAVAGLLAAHGVGPSQGQEETGVYTVEYGDSPEPSVLATRAAGTGEHLGLGDSIDAQVVGYNNAHGHPGSHALREGEQITMSTRYDTDPDQPGIQLNN